MVIQAKPLAECIQAMSAVKADPLKDRFLLGNVIAYNLDYPVCWAGRTISDKFWMPKRFIKGRNAAPRLNRFLYVHMGYIR